MNDDEASSWKLGGKGFALLVGVCALQIAAVFYDFDCLSSMGYLPIPFMYDKNDTFMDFFHPAFWANQDGRYSDWHSVYPPLNFLFLKLLCWLQTRGENFPSAFILRQMAPGLRLFLVALYIIAPAFVMTREVWTRFSGRDRFFIYIAAVCSAPLLFALERGNLIIMSFFLLPFLFSRSSLSRLVCLALLINLKPYFAPLLLVYVLKKDWDGLLLAFGLTGAIYLLTCVMIAANPFDMPVNLLDFSQNNTLFSPREVLAMPSSVSAFSYALTSDVFQKSRWYSMLPLDADSIGLILEIAKWSIEILAFAALWRVKNLTSRDQMFAVMLVMITNSGISVGGYTLIFYLVLLPVFYGMRLSAVYLLLVMLMACPLDWLVLMRQTSPPQQLSFLSGQTVDVEWDFGAGSIMRPALNWLLLASLTWELVAKPQPAISGACAPIDHAVLS